jgi:putative SOS response-associated peptidase YedK
MCGRYSLADLEDRFSRRFNVANYVSKLPPRYNVYPSQDMPVVVQDPEGNNRAELMVWGLIPHWSREPVGIINAKSETVAVKPSFKGPFRKSRCLIPATSFFEWQQTPRGKVPYCFKLKSRSQDHPLFAFAGIYDTWINAQGLPVKGFAILTCHPNHVAAPIHDRMPVILRAEEEKVWLNPHSELRTLHQLLKPYSAEWMEAYPVSRVVNSPENDSPLIIKPAS